MSEFAEWFKNTRKNMNMTQCELAHKLNFDTSQAVANIERGASKFPVKRIHRLMDAFNVDWEEIIPYLIKDYESNLRKKLKKTNG